MTESYCKSRSGVGRVTRARALANACSLSPGSTGRVRLRVAYYSAHGRQQRCSRCASLSPARHSGGCTSRLVSESHPFPGHTLPSGCLCEPDYRYPSRFDPRAMPCQLRTSDFHDLRRRYVLRTNPGKPAIQPGEAVSRRMTRIGRTVQVGPHIVVAWRDVEYPGRDHEHRLLEQPGHQTGSSSRIGFVLYSARREKDRFFSRIPRAAPTRFRA